MDTLARDEVGVTDEEGERRVDTSSDDKVDDVVLDAGIADAGKSIEE